MDYRYALRVCYGYLWFRVGLKFPSDGHHSRVVKMPGHTSKTRFFTMHQGSCGFGRLVISNPRFAGLVMAHDHPRSGLLRTTLYHDFTLYYTQESLLVELTLKPPNYPKTLEPDTFVENVLKKGIA